MDLKEKFHFAKLSLFNMRLLSDIQNSNQQVIDSLISKRALEDNLKQPVPVLHQASFLSNAYINLVWLWETMKSENKEQKIIDYVDKKFKLDEKIAIVKIGKNRNLTTCNHYLRLIRNSISHGNVDIDDDYFFFADKNPRDSDNFAEIKMTWSTLGELSDLVLFAVNNYLYFKNDKE